MKKLIICLLGVGSYASADNLSALTLQLVSTNEGNSNESFAHITTLQQLLIPRHSVNASVKPERHTEELQIGNSFFTEAAESATTNKSTISQVGLAYEDRVNMSNGYVFFNQLLSNNLFYELRAYAGYNYITQNPLPQAAGITKQTNPLNYGMVGIFGYNLSFTSRVSLLPYFRLNYLYNFVAAYSDSDGNAINSTTYTGHIGAKLSLKVNELLAVYINYFAGYQTTQLNGSGLFATGSSPAINAFVSSLEFGLPYKINQSWSITPYMQYNINANSPNSGAMDKPYNIAPLTVNNNLSAVKLSYNF